MQPFFQIPQIPQMPQGMPQPPQGAPPPGMQQPGDPHMQNIQHMMQNPHMIMQHLQMLQDPAMRARAAQHAAMRFPAPPPQAMQQLQGPGMGQMMQPQIQQPMSGAPNQIQPGNQLGAMMQPRGY